MWPTSDARTAGSAKNDCNHPGMLDNRADHRKFTCSTQPSIVLPARLCFQPKAPGRILTTRVLRSTTLPVLVQNRPGGTGQRRKKRESHRPHPLHTNLISHSPIFFWLPSCDASVMIRGTPTALPGFDAHKFKISSDSEKVTFEAERHAEL